MGYETSPFGGVGNVETKDAQGTAGTTNTHFGIRDTEDGPVSGGKVRASGSVQELAIYFKDEDFVDRAVTPVGAILPKGAMVVDVLWETSEAFVFSTGTPSLSVADSNASVTNRAGQLSNVDAVAAIVGDFNTSEGTGVNGTLSTPLGADTQMYITLSATSAVTAGRGKCVVRYRKI